MKKFFLLTILLLLPIAFAAIVKVEVRENCSLEFKSLDFEKGEIYKLKAEIYNSGSIPLIARILMDDNFKSWSQKVKLEPGEVKLLELYFVPSNQTKMKIFYCNKIEERNFSFQEKSLKYTNDFKIVSAKFFENSLFLKINSPTKTKVAILPQNYPQSWILETSTFELKKGSNLIKIGGELEAFYERNASFLIFDLERNVASYQNVKIEKMDLLTSIAIKMKENVFKIFDFFRNILINLK